MSNSKAKQLRRIARLITGNLQNGVSFDTYYKSLKRTYRDVPRPVRYTFLKRMEQIYSIKA